MRRLLLLSLTLVLGAHRLSAQALPPDSLFDRLIGRWVLRGTIAHRQTTHHVTFAWMLGREYVQMHEISRERAPKGGPAYEAVVLFHYSATDAFHTTFVYDRAADTWQWHMDNDSAGVRKPFARVTLTRR